MSNFDPPDPPEPVEHRRYTFRVPVELTVEVSVPMDRREPRWQDANVETAIVAVKSDGNEPASFGVELPGYDDDVEMIRALLAFDPDPVGGEDL